MWKLRNAETILGLKRNDFDGVLLCDERVDFVFIQKRNVLIHLICKFLFHDLEVSQCFYLSSAELHSDHSVVKLTF